MSRLNYHTYLQTHNELRRLWLRDSAAFGCLSPNDQWRLHRFYQPDHDLSQAALLAHRQSVTEAEPSLPQQAGRALRLLHERVNQPLVTHNHHARHPRIRQQRAHTNLTIRAVARPEPDVQSYVRVVMDLARRLEEDPEQMAWAEKELSKRASEPRHRGGNAD